MLMPKRTKFRKMQKGRMKGLAQRGSQVNFGDFGIKAMEPAWITSRQIEAARIAMTRHMKRAGKVWIRIFPDKPITKKPAETRMGKGKGSPEYFVAVVKPGRILFEVGGVEEELAREAMRLAMQKLPIKCKFVTRPDFHTVAPKEEAVSGEDTSVRLEVSTTDFTKIYGLGKSVATQLEEDGITTYEELAGLAADRVKALTELDDEEAAAEQAERWQKQARFLAEGDSAGFSAYVDELREQDGNVVTTDEPAAEESSDAPADEAEASDAEETE